MTPPKNDIRLNANIMEVLAWVERRRAALHEEFAVLRSRQAELLDELASADRVAEMLISDDHVSVRQAATHESLYAEQDSDRESINLTTALDSDHEGINLTTTLDSDHEGINLTTTLDSDHEGINLTTTLDSPVNYSGVDFTGCRTNRQRLCRMAAASDGFIRLRDATDTLFNLGFSSGKKENLRVGLARILSNRGERIEEGVYRMEPEG